ncbi:epidermal growth factor receptor kinase substrate 8-like protein 2 isoform X3 [Neocloeon triangulifer]|uniref:epidermal growth factor receptor kinase substrate 8-like protein 2 isoform X3 n=1 Tax=Neocloeon triangulifer TaxID=2078957 RepID=UPI00286F8DB3|nr:epidermal growth factor receptor kinase substrate 8-like protein 2 isoform X3 [Neocloeon triangulifer]
MPGVKAPSPHHQKPPKWDKKAEKKQKKSKNQEHRLSISSDMMPYRGDHHSNGYSSDQQSHGSGNEESVSPGYVMEHLATFTVSKETGIVYPADGMRRLLQLEKSNGIWSQKMQMRLERSWVMIMDYESGAVMEKFPVSLIQEPTAFTSHDPMEMYNNILVFIVGEEPSQRNGRSEMHIFQCQSISGQDLVEDLKMLRSGKMPPLRRQSHLLPPAPSTPPPEPPLNGISVRDQVNAFNAASHLPEAHNELRPSSSGGGAMYNREAAGSINDETSSTSSEKYERDVTILNHCFDDIEKFIARLQHAAAASRELERRRKSRKSKKKDMGDGMLSMRAKPPPEMEFVDIFQKFKLSFNLLAKLKSHIHDPNAPELVHFLFTPLALIVDASHDCTHYGPNLPSKVVSPLLTREAYNLLINCVTSKETELWHSLGDAWLVPKDQWKGYVAPYHPVFMDGWSPDYPVNDERDVHHSALSSAVALEAKRTRGDEIRAAQHEAELREQYYRDDSHYGSDYFDHERQGSSPHDARYHHEARNYRQERYSREERRSHTPPSERDFPGNRDVSSRSDISADSIERNGVTGGLSEQQQRFERAQHIWLDELRSRNCKVVQVTYPRTANNDKELTVVRGEYLEVLDDTRKWWKARNSRGQMAHVPHTIVTPHFDGPPGSDVFNNPLYARGYGQESPRESVSTNNERSARSPPRIGKKGKQPVQQTRPIRDSSSSSESEEERVKVKKIVVPVATPAPPPPPPPKMPPPAPKFTPPKSNFNTSKTQSGRSTDMMQEELQMVLSEWRRQRHLDIMKTPEVFIDQQSTPDEVQVWLREKAFSDKIQKKFISMNGDDLFALKKDQLISYCGREEGSRLNSQLNLMRNVSGYKTRRSAELRAILARARQKAEAGLPRTDVSSSDEEEELDEDEHKTNGHAEL